MKRAEDKEIWTIGHSTHSIDEFVAMLQSFQIDCLVDIRSMPGSRKFPQFNKENLEKSLSQNNIGYSHLINLGGRRKAKPNSKNTSWRNPSFMGYADYMETTQFKESLEVLKKIASQKKTVIMCSESLW